MVRICQFVNLVAALKFGLVGFEVNIDELFEAY